MKTQELIPIEVKSEVSVIQQQANALTIKNPDEADAAAILLKKIKDASKILATRREEITRPIMQSFASVRALFKVPESDLADAEKIVKSKLLAYDIEETERKEIAKAKILARTEKGTLRIDTAIKKMEELGEVPKIKGITSRTINKVRITDETMIPREYMVPDMTKITEAVLRQGVEIPGVEKYSEKIIAA